MYRILHCSHMYDTNVKTSVITHKYTMNFTDKHRIQAEKYLKYTS
jgi:hypothetical protein